MNKCFNYSDPYIFLYLMTLGEIIGGLSILLYQKNTSNKKKEVKYFKEILIHNKAKMKALDGSFKIAILIFLASFYDILEFMIIVFFVPKIANISPTIGDRLGSITNISASFICSYALGFKIGKHHKCSLIFMGILLCITLTSELLFQSNNIPFGKSLYAHFLICLYLIFISFTDCIEKYLGDKNFLSPSKIIMLEGIF